MPMPVSPRITAPGIQPPLGVLSKMLPSLSMMAMWVVSLTPPDTGSGSTTGWFGFAACARLATQYFHSFTPESKGSGFPATNARDAFFGSISLARSFAYAFDSNPSVGTRTKSGSA